MLSIQENEALTRVGPGTPMGELMRRYWHPIAPTAELEERPTKEFRLLGEDLVLYKDRSGRYGLIDRYCPHRRVNLAYGIPEEHGLRCMYHGWLFDESGKCTEQPFEETVHPDGRFKEKVKVAGYPVQELAGLLWTYLGPQPAPELPRWEPLIWDNSVRDIAIAELPCNWLQCQENSLDPVHVEWLHSYYAMYTKQGVHFGGRPVDLPRHQKIGFSVFDHGIIKRRVFEGYTEEDDDWKHGHPAIFPNILIVGSDASVTLQFRVPVDDEKTYHVSVYVWQAAPGHTAPVQERVPYRYVALTDEEGRYLTNMLFNQDYMTWISQGRIAAREREKLGESDRGVILLRRQLREQMDIVADGGDPMNVLRDPERARAVRTPLEHVKFGQKRATTYVPSEAGYSADAEIINQVVGTWSTVPDMAGETSHR